jgi:hypothetical protein
MLAYLVDDAAWKRLANLEPKVPEPSRGLGIHYNPFWTGIPVIRSPYSIMTAAACDYEPLSIVKDFDRWFRSTLWDIEDRRERERLRRFEQSRDSSLL